MDITILADVVDNYGDIGVAWRLTRHLIHNVNSCIEKSDFSSDSLMDEDFYKKLNIRIVTNNLKAFHNINNKIEPLLSYQKYSIQETEIEVFDWNNYDLCYKAFSKNPPEIILEMFQCGQPDWLEKILFEDRVNYKVHIIMIDYLSAEAWVDDFHCLKSLTRTAWVPKVNFMPGFTKKTGGLLLTEDSPIHNKKTSAPQKPDSQIQQVLFFAYNGNWAPVVRAMNKVLTKDSIVKIAGGAGQESICAACQNENTIFKTEKLSFMDQDMWDQNMASMDFMIIRGEDSMAQGCLLGIPFIWQAYPQKENYHMVKVEALLERMKPFFGPEFIFVENAWQKINEQEVPEGGQFSSNKNDSKSDDLENAIYNFLLNIKALKPGFERFAQSLYQNGDLANNLMTFIKKNIKIEK